MRLLLWPRSPGCAIIGDGEAVLMGHDGNRLPVYPDALLITLPIIDIVTAACYTYYYLSAAW